MWCLTFDAVFSALLQILTYQVRSLCSAFFFQAVYYSDLFQRIQFPIKAYIGETSTDPGNHEIFVSYFHKLLYEIG